MIATTSEAERLSLMGQVDLGAWIEEVFPSGLWSVQREICTTQSEYRAQQTVPSCNSSGKTHLAGRIVWAFLDSFRPGVPCVWCEGPCGGSKVITTSSTFDHLKLVLWTEIRRARLEIGDRMPHLPLCYSGALQTILFPEHPNWFIIGLNPDTAEGIQGMHAPHKLVVAEEATALGEATASGIGSLLASGDARLLCIYNPTDEGVWVERIARDPVVVRKRITAYDTPNFTGEKVPDGATLTTMDWLEGLKAKGMGPGTYEWTTRVEAKPWAVGERGLIAGEWIDLARQSRLREVGIKTLGIDLARYGDAENVIARRHGPVGVAINAYSSMDQRIFWRGPVLDEARDFKPELIIYDADGLGAGVGESIEVLTRTLEREQIGCEVIGFRGGMGAGTRYLNTRTRAWWSLRERLQNGHLAIRFDDQKFHDQATQIQYSFTDKGAIKVESKENMRRRNKPSPDRADAFMYAFAYDDISVPPPKEIRDTPDRSDEAHWKRTMSHLDELQDMRARRGEIDPIFGVPDDY